MEDPRLQPISPALWSFVTPSGSARLCALDSVPIEKAALDELSAVLGLNATFAALGRAGWGEATVDDVACTPDLHKGAGIPIGTVLATTGAVIPAAIGGDVNCGMRLVVLDVDAAELAGRRAELAVALRDRFFAGKRNLPTSPTARRALLEGGLEAFFDALDAHDWPGTWSLAAPIRDAILAKRSIQSTCPGIVSAAMDDWVNAGLPDAKAHELTYDQHLGTVGGGNHFCELGEVAELVDGQAAYGWGMTKGAVTIMAHTGSLWVGHIAAHKGRTDAERDWPDGLAWPTNNLLPIHATRADNWLGHQAAAANFAQANRLACTLMAASAVSAVLGRDVAITVIHDAAHNLCWHTGTDTFLHRKGATPAAGVGPDPAHWWGEPVIVPGSMGASSWLCAGHGNEATLASACHGAGRAVPRRQARHDDAALDAFLERFTIVTPIDAATARPDIVRAWRADISSEAPWVYKEITPVIESLVAADVAHGVARLEPLATVKA